MVVGKMPLNNLRQGGFVFGHRFERPTLSTCTSDYQVASLGDLEPVSQSSAAMYGIPQGNLHVASTITASSTEI